MLKIENGVVLGIDVGWNQNKPTTGLCLIEWTNRKLSFQCHEVGIKPDDREKKLDQMIQGRRLLAVGIDGPLIPGLREVNDYRAAEALLSRGIFQKRGKPGPTNGKIGQLLHKEANNWAKFVVKNYDIAFAKYPCGIDRRAVLEAFPNAFLEVLHPDEGYPSKKKTHRPWTDTLFPLAPVKQKLYQLLEYLLPQNNSTFNPDNIQGHEDRASFICAFTALCVVVGKYVAVGNQELGYIILPPMEFWGDSKGGTGKWAKDTLHDNLISVQSEPKFGNIQLYRDNTKWTP